MQDWSFSFFPTERPTNYLTHLKKNWSIWKNEILTLLLRTFWNQWGDLVKPLNFIILRVVEKKLLNSFFAKQKTKMLCTGLKDASSRSFGVGYLLVWTIVLYAQIQPCHG